MIKTAVSGCSSSPLSPAPLSPLRSRMILVGTITSELCLTDLYMCRPHCTCATVHVYKAVYLVAFQHFLYTVLCIHVHVESNKFFYNNYYSVHVFSPLKTARTIVYTNTCIVYIQCEVDYYSHVY